MLKITEKFNIKKDDLVTLDINNHSITGKVKNSGEGELDVNCSEYILGSLYFLTSTETDAEEPYSTGYALVETKAFNLDVIGLLPKQITIKKHGEESSAMLKLISIIGGNNSYLLFCVPDNLPR
jgi:hypothetical protein